MTTLPRDNVTWNFYREMRLLERIVALLSWCSSVCPFVRLSACLSGTGVHCDHTVYFTADLSLWLDSQTFRLTWHQSMSTYSQPSFSSSTSNRRGVWMCKLGMISQEQLKIALKYDHNARPSQTDRRTNIMAIARRFVLTNASRAKKWEVTKTKTMTFISRQRYIQQHWSVTTNLKPRPHQQQSRSNSDASTVGNFVSSDKVQCYTELRVQATYRAVNFLSPLSDP